MPQLRVVLGSLSTVGIGCTIEYIHGDYVVTQAKHFVGQAFRGALRRAIEGRSAR